MKTVAFSGRFLALAAFLGLLSAIPGGCSSTPSANGSRGQTSTGSHTGGAGGVGGAGTGGGATQCNLPTDCPGTDSDCAQRTCTDGVCGSGFKPAGFPVTAQTAGDCETAVCDGHGAVKMVPDSTDLPNDSNPCTQDLCNGGTPEHPAAPAGTTCGQKLMCDGMGHCAGCTKDADCGTATTCTSYSCDTGTGVCSTVYTPNGQGNPGGQTAGDCQKLVCNGNGGTTSIEDDTDVPPNASSCTLGACSTGTPAEKPAPSGTSCGNGATCDGAGNCTKCASDADCGTTTACVSYACMNGACSKTFVPSGQGMPPGDVKGDCQKLVCDGMGATKLVADGTDLPDDGNPCTNDLCNNGVPSHTNVASGTSCGTNLKCDGNGKCVGCVADADCGTNSACVTHTCQAGSCVTEDTPSGIACPDDGNPCTGDACNGMGTCAHPTEPLGTSCGAGQVCNSGGTCAMGCVIGGTFYAAGTVNPGNSCQACTTATSTSAWSNKANGTACNDGNACTKSDVCTNGACGGTSFSCSPTACQASSTCNGTGCTVTDKASGTACPDDGNPCTTDSCDGSGNCTHPSAPTGTACGSGLICNASGSCASACDIGGTVYASGTANPGNACQTCKPSTSTSSWTNVANGTGCNDGNACTSSDVCTNGTCGGSSYSCTPTICQATSTCNGSGGCSVTNKANGTACTDDGNPCTTDTCDGSGNCKHPNAAAGTACPSGVCNGSGSCVQCISNAQCTSPNTCGGGGTPNVCGCTDEPVTTTCGNLGQVCGTAHNNCGHVVSCGSCPGSGHCCFDSCVCSSCQCP